jgi:two-component system, chemotaxis family, response regulator Rcp1
MRTASEILLVDDNPADLDLTIDALAQSRWRTNVSTVSDGEEAMAYLRREGKYTASTRPHRCCWTSISPARMGGRSWPI